MMRRRVLLRAVFVVVMAGALLAGAGMEETEARGLPAVQTAALNQWITPPASGAMLSYKDFPEGSVIRHIVYQFARQGQVAITGVYRIRAGAGHYTALYKAPPKEFHLAMGTWVFGDPYTGSDSGPEAVAYLNAHASYQPARFACREYGKRVNFAVSPASSGRDIYLVTMAKKPGIVISLMLQHPGAPDHEVNASGSYPPWCPESKGTSWGHVLTKKPFTLQAVVGGGQAEPSGGKAPQGVTGQLASANPASAQPINASPAGAMCPPGYEEIPGQQGKGCAKCPAGFQLTRVASLGKGVSVACLKCPKGMELTVVRHEKGVNPGGLPFTRNNYACMSCPAGFELVFPTLRNGTHPSGTNFSTRLAGCWRCPHGSRRAERVRGTVLPDGTKQEQKTYYCVP